MQKLELQLALDYYTLIFDKVRLVDPLAKQVQILSQTNGKIDITYTGHTCFDNWAKSSPCENCTSMRTYHDKKQYTKIECKGQNLYSVMTVPIQVETNKWCVLELIKDITESDFILSHEECIAQKIQAINHLAITDELTRLFNRRYINEQLPVEIHNLNAQQEALTIALLDIDFFKVINDTYGHILGDTVLKQLAQAINHFANSLNGWFARYGGEEFLLVFKHSPVTPSKPQLEQVRQLVENLNISSQDQAIPVTISIGSITTTYKLPMQSLINLADINLYKAKKNGRNKVCHTYAHKQYTHH